MTSIPGAMSWMDERVWWSSRMAVALDMLEDGNAEGARINMRQWLAEDRVRDEQDTP